LNNESVFAPIYINVILLSLNQVYFDTAENLIPKILLLHKIFLCLITRTLLDYVVMKIFIISM